MLKHCSTKYILLFSSICLFSVPVKAQIVPDSSLESSPSIVDPDQVVNGVPSDLITGGASRGSTLFHSFQEFNVLSDRGAYFKNPDEITNILTRVTGSNPSNILGTLGVLGEANLFFLNPNGILFDPGAVLDLNGSFLATTATDIKLSDGFSFSAVSPDNVPPLLTVAVPLGLGFIGSPGSIEVQGVGHNLVQPSPNQAFPISSLDDQTPIGIAVKPAHTLALVGGDVNFTGGIVNAPSGRIEVGSVASGEVGITSNELDGFSLNFSGIESFKNILLSRHSLLNGSGIKNGSIRLFGKNVALTDSSAIFITNLGAASLGSIDINASDSLTITGITASTNLSNAQNFQIPLNGIISQTIYGDGADINISTRRLVVNDVGIIEQLNFGPNSSGNININASDSVQFLGNSLFAQYYPYSSFATTITTGSGLAGTITVSTKQLSLENGSLIQSATYGNGNSGVVNVNASESINISGTNSIYSTSSTLGSLTIGSGKAGDLFISTRQLKIQNGGEVNSSTFASGAAGSLVVKASDFVTISGTVAGLSDEPSGITSSAPRANALFAQFYGLNPTPTGSAGEVSINTNQLNITNGAEIAVRNDGINNGGVVGVYAGSILLDNSGRITAATASGKGGNITLNSKDILLRNNSSITATAGIAGAGGDGGNITIGTNTLAALENSDITANAFEGRGGNIQINTQGIFRSPESDITASSERGIDGVVDITTLGFDVRNALTSFTGKLVTTEQVIAGSCLARRNTERGSFVFTGNGGLPLSPYSGIEEWPSLTGPQPGEADNVPVSQPQSSLNQEVAPAVPTKWKLGDPIVEAQGLVKTADGRTLLAMVPQGATPEPPESLVCHPN